MIALIFGVIFIIIFVITMFILPPLLGWYFPNILSWQDFLDAINTLEGLIVGLITEVVPVISIIIGAIFVIIFLVKLIQGKE